ncbi:MAG: hypothetical protein ACQEVA_23825 [Myxococcota bacterium]
MDIDDYKDREPQVAKVSGDWLEVFVGDDIPAVGHLLRISSPDGEEHVYAAVTAHTGGRVVRALIFDDPAWLAEGCAVETTQTRSAFPAPQRGTLELDRVSLSTEGETGVPFELRSPGFTEMSSERPALELGLDGIDRVAPMARGGLNLLLDNQPGTGALHEIAQRTRNATDADAVIWVGAKKREAPDWPGYRIQAAQGREFAAYRLAMSWAQALSEEHGKLLVIAELPALSAGTATEVEIAMGVSIGDVIDTFGTALASTISTQITTLLWLPLAECADGIATIIETMHLGDVDTELFIDEDGRFDPFRSTSDADLDDAQQRARSDALRTLSKARDIREKVQMFGDDDVAPDEQEVLRTAEGLKSRIVE